MLALKSKWKLIALSAALFILLPVMINQGNIAIKQNEFKADAAPTCDNLSVASVTAGA